MAALRAACGAPTVCATPTSRDGALTKHGVQATSRQIHGTTLDSLKDASTEIRDTTRKNGEALHQALAQVPGLLRESGELVRDGQDVVGAARNSWLLRDNIEVKSMRSLPVDSFESTGGAGARR